MFPGTFDPEAYEQRRAQRAPPAGHRREPTSPTPSCGCSPTGRARSPAASSWSTPARPSAAPDARIHRPRRGSRHDDVLTACSSGGAMVRLSDPVFKDATVDLPSPPGRDVAALKTYRYLRLGMLAATAALAYSIVEEARKPGVGCFLGSISGYYYTPVHSVFVGVMVLIGVMLLVIKGRTVIEDACLSLAGMMAPIVAFIPTSDDVEGVCRVPMLDAGRYEPARGSPVVSASINNNLHAFAVRGVRRDRPVPRRVPHPTQAARHPAGVHDRHLGEPGRGTGPARRRGRRCCAGRTTGCWTATLAPCAPCSSSSRSRPWRTATSGSSSSRPQESSRGSTVPSASR